LAGVFAVKGLLFTDLDAAGTFVLEFGRGVNGFVEEVRDTMVAGGGGPGEDGGVGALPVDGFMDVVVDGLAFSLGLRNIGSRSESED